MKYVQYALLTLMWIAAIGLVIVEVNPATPAGNIWMVIINSAYAYFLVSVKRSTGE